MVVGLAESGIATRCANRQQSVTPSFCESMIPHHSGAILMCQETSITDAEIVTLCREIVES